MYGRLNRRIAPLPRGAERALFALSGFEGLNNKDFKHVVSGPIFLGGQFVNFLEDFRFKPDTELFFAHKELSAK